MIRIRSLGFLLFLWISIWLGGCGETEEILFFSSETTDATYEEGVYPSMSGQETVSILVYVCGAVESPGVVELEQDARVVDAIALAGGMTSEADETYVNLAARLTDGEKIYIPTVAEVLRLEAREEKKNLININTADIDELCTLSGIGESKAEEIIAYRERNGSFRTIEELMKVPGIKESLFQKLAEKITVD